MGFNEDLKWNVLSVDYPEVAEGMLAAAGLTDESWKDGEILEHHETVFEFFIHEFKGDELTGEELFQRFKEEKKGELEEGSRLLEEEYFFGILGQLTASGRLPRIPLPDGGFHYTTPLHCLRHLKHQGESEDVEIDQLYRFEDKTGLPLQVLVMQAMKEDIISLAMPEAEKDSGQK